MADIYRRNSLVASTLLSVLGLSACPSAETREEFAALRQEDRHQQAEIDALRAELNMTRQEVAQATSASLTTSDRVQRAMSSYGGERRTIQDTFADFRQRLDRVEQAHGQDRYAYLDALLQQAQDQTQRSPEQERDRRLAYFPTFQTAVSRYRELDQAIVTLSHERELLEQKQQMDLTGYFHEGAGSFPREFRVAWALQARRYDEFLWAGTALHDAYGRAIVRIQQFMNQPDAGFVGFNELSDGCDVMFLERIAGVIIPDLSRHLVVGQRMGEFEVYLREHDSSSVSEYSSPCGGSFDVHRIFARSGPNATENWETMCAGAPCIGISPDGHIYLWNPHGFGRLRGGSIGTISDIDAALR